MREHKDTFPPLSPANATYPHSAVEYTLSELESFDISQKLRRRHSRLQPKHPREMLRILKAETIGGLGYLMSAHEHTLCLVNDEMTDIMRGCIACSRFDHIAEIVGREKHLACTIGHTRRAILDLQLFLIILLKDLPKANKEVALP